MDDASAWLLNLLFLPGDAVLSLLIVHAPSMARFLGVSPADYGGTLSHVVSVAVWLTGCVLSVVIVKAVRSLDRALTAYVSGWRNRVLRRLRILRRKVTSWIGWLRYVHRSKSPDVSVRDVELENIEAGVLRCYANEGDPMLTTNDVAAKLKVSIRRVHRAVGRLVDLHLIEPTFGADAERADYQVTKAGVFYLIGR